jgi:hypothetical protein
MTLPNLATLEADARFHRERLARYRARLHGGRATSEPRFRELQRAAHLADGRLLLARRESAHLN